MLHHRQKFTHTFNDIISTENLLAAWREFVSGKRNKELETVNHTKGEYVRGKAHINTIETFISHIKRSINGTFKTISKEHLQSYLDAFVFHYNNRHNDRARFSLLLETVLHA